MHMPASFSAGFALGILFLSIPSSTVAGPGDSTPKLSDIRITYATSAEFYTIEIIGGGYCLVSDNTSEWGAGWTTTPEFYSEVVQR